MRLQKVTAAMANAIRSLKTVSASPIEPKDGGFAFTVVGRDGAVMSVTVRLEQPPAVIESKPHRTSQLEIVAARKQRRYADALDRKRRRFLGEL